MNQSRRIFELAILEKQKGKEQEYDQMCQKYFPLNQLNIPNINDYFLFSVERKRKLFLGICVIHSVSYHKENDDLHFEYEYSLRLGIDKKHNKHDIEFASRIMPQLITDLKKDAHQKAEQMVTKELKAKYQVDPIS